MGQENAVWSESKYLRGYKPSTSELLTDQQLKDYANTLRENKIKYSYLFAGPYQFDGHLPDYPFKELAINNVKKLKKYYPEIIILPWVGGIQNKSVFLDDSVWVKNALADTKRLIQTLDVPGIHIDFEFIEKGDPYLKLIESDINPGDREVYADNVNHFHKELRELLPDTFISSVVVSTAPGTKPWKRKTTIDELKELIRHIDQLSFLFYDTSISEQKVFQENCEAQIRDILTLSKEDIDHEVQYLLAIGTFVNEPQLRKYRDLRIENIPNSINTIKRSSKRISKNTQIVDGLSIFCEWHTVQDEWKMISTYW